MQFLVNARSLTESFEKSQFDELRPAERRAVRTLYAQGIVRNAWHCEDGRVILLMEGRDRPEIAATLATLPFSQRGMLDCEVIALQGFEGFGPDS
jgi:muconolactone delta-isomerase